MITIVLSTGCRFSLIQLIGPEHKESPKIQAYKSHFLINHKDIIEKSISR
jgi:hypothetical protein